MTQPLPGWVRAALATAFVAFLGLVYALFFAARNLEKSEGASGYLIHVEGTPKSLCGLVEGVMQSGPGTEVYLGGESGLAHLEQRLKDWQLEAVLDRKFCESTGLYGQKIQVMADRTSCKEATGFALGNLDCFVVSDAYPRVD